MDVRVSFGLSIHHYMMGYLVLDSLLFVGHEIYERRFRVFHWNIS